MKTKIICKDCWHSEIRMLSNKIQPYILFCKLKKKEIINCNLICKAFIFEPITATAQSINLQCHKMNYEKRKNINIDNSIIGQHYNYLIIDDIIPDNTNKLPEYLL